MSKRPVRALPHKLKTYWDRLANMAPRAQEKLLEYYSDNIDGSDLEALKEALYDGQDLNVLLDETLIVRATPKSGCVMFPDIPDHEAWVHWNTPLHHASWHADLEAAEILLKRGADIDFYNSIGRTPLHEAVWNKRYDVVRFLLEKGADVNKLTVEKKVRYEDKGRDLFGRGGELCLQIALYLSDMDMLRLLLEFGADLRHESQKPWTAFDLALWAGDREALSVLMAHDESIFEKAFFGEEISSGRDSAAASRELLAAASASDDLVPPIHLYNPRHHTCQATYSRLSKSDSVPGRLLYVGDESKQEHPRVVEGVRDQPYFALSYCWGSTGFFTTTKANLAQNMSGIPLESLPAVMRDGVVVTRALGDEYIWIDTLCIIQDDEDDWAREAAGMHDIYSEAELTLSSVTSSDCHTGLFTPRIHRVPHPLPLDIWRPRRLRKAGKAFMAIPEWMQEGPQLHGPVHARAWTLQEQMLSTRVLWFGDGMVYWECLAGCSLEANPTLFAAIDDGSGKYHTWKRELERELRIKLVVKGAAHSSSDESEEEISLGEEQRLFQCWQKLLEDFTQRRITKTSDRLPASLAISTTLAGLAGCEHAHGIWLGQRLLQSLCWRVKKQKQGLERSSEMPSWLWAGVGTSILFDLDDSAERGATINPIPCVDIVSLDTRVSTSMNRVSGSLTVKGTLFKRRPLKSLYLKTENPSSVRSFLERADHEKTVFFDEWNDCIDECYAVKLLTFPRGEEYKGMGYPRFPGGKQPNTLHLLLQQIHGQPDAFRRIGIALEPAEHEDLNWEEGEGMTAFRWLVTNEEIYENREIRLV